MVAGVMFVSVDKLSNSIGTLQISAATVPATGAAANTGAAADTGAAANTGAKADVAAVNINTNGSYSLGPADAKVTVVMFADYQCPFCGAAEGTRQDVIDYLKSKYAAYESPIPKLKSEYIAKGASVKYIFKNYAFLGQESLDAANAAECAGVQGKFWEMHVKLFSSQKGENQGDFSIANLKTFGADIGLDTAKYNACIDGNTYASKVQQDMKDGSAAGVSGTPSLFVNGKPVSADWASLKTAVDAELAK
ncbi:Thioredoxin [Candidatus Gugararchaeum adminiculabundum]|nr:Thioredoxin [Candidatus Gugararchaeum adminiculabundum]